MAEVGQRHTESTGNAHLGHRHGETTFGNVVTRFDQACPNATVK